VRLEREVLPASALQEVYQTTYTHYRQLYEKLRITMS